MTAGWIKNPTPANSLFVPLPKLMKRKPLERNCVQRSYIESGHLYSLTVFDFRWGPGPCRGDLDCPSPLALSPGNRWGFRALVLQLRGPLPPVRKIAFDEC
eukprot:13780064-Alexandrium_andersonii.AAC.1